MGFNLTEIIRTAYLECAWRSEVFESVQRQVGCALWQAQSMCEAFLYFNSEDYLQEILGDDND
jgi:hypothetical protein